MSRTPGPFLFVANPHAGRGFALDRVHEAAAYLRAAGVEARAEVTRSIEHATELATGAALIGTTPVAVGGDGLVRAVAAGTARHGGTMGIIPAGRGNDFARAVGIPEDLEHAVRVLLETEPKPTDCIAVQAEAGGSVAREDVAAAGSASTGGARGEVAIGNVYLGFDSLSNIAANQLRVNLGRHAYAYAALRVALTMPRLHFGLTIDGEPLDFAGSGVAIASSAFYGGAVRVAPGALVDDGLLDVVLFEQTSRAARVRAMLALRQGRHVDRPGVRVLRAAEIRVDVEPAVVAYSDGDEIAHAPFTARVLHHAIGMLRP